MSAQSTTPLLDNPGCVRRIVIESLSRAPILVLDGWEANQSVRNDLQFVTD